MDGKKQYERSNNRSGKISIKPRGDVQLREVETQKVTTQSQDFFVEHARIPMGSL